MVKKIIFAILIAGGLLLLSGCVGAAQVETADVSEDELVITASFTQEDGIALRDSTIRFSFGDSTLERSLDDQGDLNISGLPRVGDLMLTILDPQEQVQGSMTIFLSEGTVIDATTSESGIGYITLRRDTDEVALLFVLRNDGSLLCSLQLTQPDLHSLDLSQEDNQRGA